MGAAVISALGNSISLNREESHEGLGAKGVADPGTRLPVQVVLRPLASGLPIGFFGLVAAAGLTGADAYGFLPKSADLAVGLLLFPTVLFQLVGGISAIASRDVISASLLLLFSGVWLGTALVYCLHPADGTAALAIWYFCVGPVILVLISSATGKLALTMVPVTGFPTFMLAGVWLLLGGAGLGQAVGVLSFVLAAVALYVSLALLFEDSRRRTVLPTLRRGPMRDAFEEGFARQLDDLEHEAGVRRAL